MWGLCGDKLKRPIYKVLQIGHCKELFVLEAGIEPARLSTLDFESSASTNSATRANGRQK